MTALLQEYVARSAELEGERVALVMDGERVTYGELEAASNQLARLLVEAGYRRSPCWLGPFHNYNFCSYLVGTHECVARELAHYMGLGSTHFILDIPPFVEELDHIGVVLDEAVATARD